MCQRDNNNVCIVTVTIAPDNPIKVVNKNPDKAFELAKEKFNDKYKEIKCSN